ncbi:MAG: hypothetical protein ACT4O9_02890 [Blastocatellia bacterium]
MSITIKVSEKTEENIRRQAAKSGQNAEKVVSDLVEEVWDDHFPENGNNPVEQEFKNPFEPFIGMFSSGKTDTSTRYKESLREDIKMPCGWGGK